MNKLVFTALFGMALLAFIAPATAGTGAKTHGDSCNLIASGIQLFSDNNYAEACDKDKNLVCAINKCTCLPGFRWEQNFVEQTFGVGGICVNGAPVLGGSAFIALVVAFLVNRLF